MGSRVQRHGGPHSATPDVVRAPGISKRRDLHVRAGRTASLPEDATVRSVLAIRRPDRESRYSPLATRVLIRAYTAKQLTEAVLATAEEQPRQ